MDSGPKALDVPRLVVPSVVSDDETGLNPPVDPLGRDYVRVWTESKGEFSYQDVKLGIGGEGVLELLLNEAIKRAAGKLGIDLKISLELPEQIQSLRLLPRHPSSKCQSKISNREE